MKTTFTKLLPAVIILLFQNISNGKSNSVIFNSASSHNYIYSLAPTQQNDSVAVCENSGTTKIQVEGTDSIIERAPVILSGPRNGTSSVSGKSINYTPNNNFAGKDTIVYVVCDTGIIVSCVTDSLFITVRPSPIVVTGAGQTICYGDTISIGAPPVAGFSYQWSPDKGLSSYTISNPKASPADTTTYTLTVTNSTTGCKNTDSILIIVKPVPDAFIIEGDSAEFCEGQPLTLTASNGASYTWSNGSTTKTIPVDSGEVYSVGVTYPNGCTSYSAPTLVVVNALPVAKAGRDTSVCKGDSVLIGAAAIKGMAYKWSPSTGLNYDTIAQPFASPSSTTQYVLTVTDTLLGCQNTDTIVVTVVPQPVANAGPDKTICKGDSTNIGSLPVLGISYSWTPSAGLSSTTEAQPIASPTVTTAYILTASNGFCSNTDTVVVTIVPQPAANAGEGKTICKGDSATIGTTTVAGISYSWSPSAGLNYDTIAQPNASPSVTTTYILTASNGTCSNKDSVIVTVVPQPIANAGSAKTICRNDSVVIGTASVAGTYYTWVPSTGLNSSTLAQPNVSPSVTTTYTLTASNGTCSNKDSVIITVIPQPTANAGPDKTICKGDSTNIGTNAVAGISYRWSPSAGLNYDTIAQPIASPSITTQYILTVTNTATGCHNTDTVIVTVTPQPTANAGPDKTVCKGDSTSIGALAIIGTSYKWTPSAGLSSTTDAQPNVSPSVTTTYILTASNGTCSNTDTVVVTVVPKPTANAGTDKTICKGDSVTIGTTGLAGTSYSWSPSAGLNHDTIAQPIANPSVTTTYTLTVSNGTCTNKDSVIVTVAPQPIANAGANKTICKGDSTIIGTVSVSGTSYTWSPSTGLNSTTMAQPNASPTVTTTYTLTASNGTCSNKDTVIITIVAQPVANAGTSKTICKGDSTIIGAPAVAGISYSWSPSAGLNSSTLSQPNVSPSATTTYTLTASNGTCSNKDSVVVTVTPQPIANAGPDKTICNGNSVTIGTSAVAGTSYSWSPSTGLNSSTMAQPTANPSVTTTYTLTASNGTCGNSKDTVVVTVVPPPIANAGSNKTICMGDTTSIGTSSSAGVTYSWTPSNGLSSSTASNTVADPASTTTYTLTATNTGCSNKDSVIVKVNPLPAANVGAEQSLCDAGTVILGAPPVTGDTYVWTPSTGLNSTTISAPTANPNSTTIYTLVETDTATGCTKSNQVQVTSSGGTEIYSGISPNGDGINDWWYVPMLDCYPNNTVVIVNRWGCEVWTGTDYNNTTVRWDGKDMAGTDLPEGTYYYMIRYNDTEKQGWVFIKR